jgi:hypothetical protein
LALSSRLAGDLPFSTAEPAEVEPDARITGVLVDVWAGATRVHAALPAEEVLRGVDEARLFRSTSVLPNDVR